MTSGRKRVRILTLNDPHSLRVNRELSVEIGFQESIVFLQLEFLISISELEREGRTWTRQSLQELRENHFPYWSTATIGRILERLEASELIDSRNHNRAKYDRATVGEHENQHTRPRVQDNNVIVQQGNSDTYALRKLRKDRPDLFGRVLSEEISPHAAMVEACCVRTSRNVPDWLELATRLIRPISDKRYSRKPAFTRPDRPTPPGGTSS